MTICIGLIPNKDTVMLMQDSETTYRDLGFTQDIVAKIKHLSATSIVGTIGSGVLANEVLALLDGKTFDNSVELRTSITEAYHVVRESHMANGILRKFGFQHIREITDLKEDRRIDSTVKEEILTSIKNQDNNYSLTLMVASYIKQPEIFKVAYPGDGVLEDNVKMYLVGGSGYIMAIDKLGEQLEEHKWEKELSIPEAINVLIRTGKASEKHQGVGGPFDITYITRQGDQTITVKLNEKKLNMVMYLLPYNVPEKIILSLLQQVQDEKVTIPQLGQYITETTGVGIEFKHYFKL